jgi:hypothetical protein
MKKSTPRLLVPWQKLLHQSIKEETQLGYSQGKDAAERLTGDYLLPCDLHGFGIAVRKSRHHPSIWELID